MRVLITDTFARNYRPTKAREDIFDSQCSGLRLRISKSGAKSWDYRYKSPTTGKIVSMRIGSFPATGVGAARARALEALSHVEAGRDPREVFADEDEAGLTVAQLIDKYLELRPNEHKHGMTSAPKVRQYMDKHVIPKIGVVRVIDLRQRHLNEITEPILAASHRAMANRVVSHLKSMTRWAKRQKGYIESDPLADAGKPAEKSEPKKHTLNNEELMLFQQRLDTAIPDNPHRVILPSRTVRRILMLILLTGCRPGEASGLRRTEIDLETATWKMEDPMRCKNRREHDFHLSPPALAIVIAAMADARGSKYVFPTTGKSPFPRVANIDKVLELAVRPSKKHPRGRFTLAKFTPHDLRRSALDGLTRLGTPPHVVSAIANHQVSGVTAKHYVSSTYERERKEALRQWADHLASLIDPNKVVSLPKRA